MSLNLNPEHVLRRLSNKLIIKDRQIKSLGKRINQLENQNSMLLYFLGELNRDKDNYIYTNLKKYRETVEKENKYLLDKKILNIINDNIAKVLYDIITKVEKVDKLDGRINEIRNLSNNEEIYNKDIYIINEKLDKLKKIILNKSSAKDIANLKLEIKNDITNALPELQQRIKDGFLEEMNNLKELENIHNEKYEYFSSDTDDNEDSDSN